MVGQDRGLHGQGGTSSYPREGDKASTWPTTPIAPLSATPRASWVLFSRAWCTGRASLPPELPGQISGLPGLARPVVWRADGQAARRRGNGLDAVCCLRGLPTALRALHSARRSYPREDDEPLGSPWSDHANGLWLLESANSYQSVAIGQMAGCANGYRSAIRRASREVRFFSAGSGARASSKWQIQAGASGLVVVGRRAGGSGLEVGRWSNWHSQAGGVAWLQCADSGAGLL